MVNFEKIEERDIDLIIMRSFVSIPEFLELFTVKLGWDDAKVIRVEHSLTDPELGESDVTVLVERDTAVCALLIENKIDANAMPNQYCRYDERAKRGMDDAKYSDYAVFITAPQNYLDTNREAQKYPYCVSYETMRAFFESKELYFECEVIKTAIKKKESGYTVQEVPSITEFWKEMYAYISQSKFRCEMYPTDGPKGSRAKWVQFRVPLKGTSLYFKSAKGFADMEFSGKLSESFRLKAAINLYKDDDMYWEETGKSISLRIKVCPIDFRTSFYECINDIDIMLAAVERLTTLSTKLNDIGFVV